MLKQAVKRGLLGIPLGIGISFVITVIISVAVGDGLYHPVAQTLADQFDNQINAVVFQMVLSGLLGAGSYAASVIWDIEKWGLAKQTGLYFIALSAIMLPVAYFAHWMPRSAAGVLSYIAIFVVIFAVICTINYVVWRGRIAVWRGRIKKMNDKTPRGRD